jgi:hypothetical protein
MQEGIFDMEGFYIIYDKGAANCEAGQNRHECSRC